MTINIDAQTQIIVDIILVIFSSLFMHFGKDFDVETYTAKANHKQSYFITSKKINRNQINQSQWIQSWKSTNKMIITPENIAPHQVHSLKYYVHLIQRLAFSKINICLLVWSKIVWGCLYVYKINEFYMNHSDANQPNHQVTLFTNFRLTLVIGIIVATSLVGKVNHYMSLRDKVFWKSVAMGAYVEKFAAIFAVANLSEDRKYKIFRYLNVLHFSFYWAGGKNISDERFETLDYLVNYNFLTTAELNRIKIGGAHHTILKMILENYNFEDNNHAINEAVMDAIWKFPVSGGINTKLSYPPSTHANFTKFGVYLFIILVPFEVWKENNGWICNLLALIVIGTMCHRALLIINDKNMLDLSEYYQDPYGFNPDMFLTRSAIMTWAHLYHNENQMLQLCKDAKYGVEYQKHREA